MKFNADVIKMNWDEFIKPETRPKREKEKKSNSLYLALLVIVILLVAVYLLYSGGVTTTDRSQFGAAVPTPGTDAEARQVANDLGESLDETSSIIDDLSTSLGE